MTDQDCIAVIRIELAIGFVDQLIRRQSLAAFHDKRGIEYSGLRNDNAQAIVCGALLHA